MRVYVLALQLCPDETAAEDEDIAAADTDLEEVRIFLDFVCLFCHPCTSALLTSCRLPTFGPPPLLIDDPTLD